MQSFHYLQNVVHNTNHNEYDVVELEYEKPSIPVVPKKQHRRNTNTTDNATSTASTVYTIYKHFSLNLQYNWKNKSRDILDITSVNSVSLESMTAYPHILILQRVIYR